MSSRKSSWQEVLFRIRDCFPDALTENERIGEDGKPYIVYGLKDEFLDELQGLVDVFDDNDRYELRFPGKRRARLQAQIPSDKTLITEKGIDTDFNETGNLFIEGDNLDVLRMLQKAYRGRIKMIYIDPPYNTGNDEFTYADDFSRSQQEYLKDIGVLDEDGVRCISELKDGLRGRFHAGWLAMMYPRLKLARELLTDDGVIFISIDDNEQANLKLICDEIFGEINFQYCLSVINNLNGNDNSSGMMETHDYCFIYSKDANGFRMGVLDVEQESVVKEWQQDDIGFWKKGGSLKATGINAPRSARKNLYFPIYINPEDNNISLKRTNIHTHELFPITNNQEMSWYWSREKFIRDRHEVIVERTKNGFSLYKKQRPSLGDLPSKRGKTTFYDPEYSNSHSNRTIKDLFGKSVFQYSKSITLIKNLIRLGLCEKDIVLDFFAGSATTAHAVMQLNAEDGGERRFVMVQLPERIDPKRSKEAYDFCVDNLPPPPPPRKFRGSGIPGFPFPTIADIARERIRRAGEKIVKEHPEKSIDIGFRSLRVVDSVFSRDAETTLADTRQGDLYAHHTDLSAERFEYLLFETLLETGVMLDRPLHLHEALSYRFAICDRRCYCLTEGLTQEIVQAIIEAHGPDFDILYYLGDCPASKTSHAELEAPIKLGPSDKRIEMLNFY